MTEATVVNSGSPAPGGAVLERSERAIGQAVGGELVLLDPDTEDFVALNGVATRVWELLSAPHTPATLAAAIAEEYDVESGVARADVDALLVTLRSMRLVRDAAPSTAGAPAHR